MPRAPLSPCVVLLLALAAAPFPEEVHAATAQVTSGLTFSVALGTDGRVRTWGDDSAGALGIGRPLWSCPAVVPHATGITAISAGDGFVLALKDDRTVLAWGDNHSGQLGDDSTTARPTPAAVLGLGNVIQVAAGTARSLALTAAGEVWQWGAGSPNTPRRVDGITGVTKISAGFGFQLALRGDGTVWARGENDSGELGDGTTLDRAVPMLVQGLDNVTEISAGTGFALALRSDGTVWAWGDNTFGALGDGSTTNRPRPGRVSGLDGIVSIEAGHGPAFALAGSGAAWGWGRNGQNELGLNTYESRSLPVRLPGIEGAASLSAHYVHFMARMPDGTLRSWGLVGGSCVLGAEGMTGTTPQPVPGLSGVREVSAGGAFTVALMNDGRVLTWGDNTRGQLGNTLHRYRTTPNLVPLTDVTRVAASWYHVTALRGDGSVFAWGDDTSSQLGVGTNYEHRPSPVAVTGLGAGSGVREIASGARFTLALKGDGTVWSWGDNAFGQLARPGTSVPAPIPDLSGVTDIAPGAGHGLVRRSDGSVWTWGANGSGQLGDGMRTSRSTPMPVPGLANVRLVSAGSEHNLVVTADGALWAWGRNDLGQLGDGTRVDRLSPVRVAQGLADVAAISAGSDYSLALRTDGTVWAWGGGHRLADGAYQTRATPGLVPGLTRVASIFARDTAMARRLDGSVLAWGFNAFGQIGDGTLVPRPQPVVVVREGGAGSLEGNDWFLDLDPAATNDVPQEAPKILAVASNVNSAVVADVRFRAADVGTSGSLFVFALAPATMVSGRSDFESGLKARTADGKDTGIACVLAQLNAAGQMVAVSSGNLIAYLTGVLGAQGQSVTILNGTPASGSGATFFVGYGSSASVMISSGNNRGMVTLPGSATCRPEAPQTGWWWNPAEDGRGFSIEKRGNNLFFAAFLYDASGRSSWLVSSGPVSLDGAWYSGDLLSARGGQTLGGPYAGRPQLGNEGIVTLTFNAASEGTLVWPGGTSRIQRFPIVANGLTAPAVAGMPESGWWWNEGESGRGFFLEWQGNTLDIAGYMYDDAGNPVWYLTVGNMNADGRTFSGNWWSYGNGMTLAGPWRQHQRINDNVAPLTITFSASDTALMTLPNGRTTQLRRHRF